MRIRAFSCRSLIARGWLKKPGHRLIMRNRNLRHWFGVGLCLLILFLYVCLRLNETDELGPGFGEEERSRFCSCGDRAPPRAEDVSTCSDPRASASSAIRRPNTVISYSIFGQGAASWALGVSRNLQWIPTVYPNWTVRVYHNSFEGSRVCDALCAVRQEHPFLHLCHIRWSIPTQLDGRLSVGDVASVIPGTMWRFLPMADPLVEAFICRDSDSIVSRREAAAVEEWLAAGNTTLHTMNDHPGHVWPVLAGMWGINFLSRNPTRIAVTSEGRISDRNDDHGNGKVSGSDLASPLNPSGSARNIRRLLEGMLVQMFQDAAVGLGYFKEVDQSVLKATVASYFRGTGDWTNHASYYCGKFGVPSVPFPTRRRREESGTFYVGERISYLHRIMGFFPRILNDFVMNVVIAFKRDRMPQECPIECRPNDGKFWAYC